MERQFSISVTAEQNEILESIADVLSCSRAAAVRLLIDVGSKHLEIRG